MVKKLSLNISDEKYEELALLSGFYKQDVKQMIDSAMDVLSANRRWLISLSEEYKAPVDFDRVLRDVFWLAGSSMYFFYKIPEKLGVKGLFRLDDFDFDLDEDYFMFAYSALSGSNLLVDAFYVWLERGGKTLSAHSIIEVNEVDKRSLDKLKEAIKDFDTPEGFQELEEFNVEIEEEEEFWTLKVDCVVETLDYLPSIRQVSRFLRQIFKKAGIR